MISQLQGILLDKQAPSLIIDCQGVGYEVQAPMTTIYALPKVGEQVTVFTHLSIRDDAHLLYGFSDREQKVLFRELIKVNSVGPKLALAILSSLTPVEFVQHVAHNDITALVRLPGIGKKTAERLIVEMKDRLKDWLIESANETEKTPKRVNAESSSHDATKEAVSALIALGYKPQEASKAIAKINHPEASSESLIKQALKGMA